MKKLYGKRILPRFYPYFQRPNIGFASPGFMSDVDFFISELDFSKLLRDFSFRDLPWSTSNIGCCTKGDFHLYLTHD